MNSKEQKIKEEYKKELLKDSINEKASLEFLENLFPYIDSNGWIDSEKYEGYSGYLMESELEIKFPFLRLKSLQGIENNNGWIKIESEDDLPKEDVDCFLCSHDGYIYCDRYLLNTKNFLSSHYKYITHYQPITKPQPPLY